MPASSDIAHQLAIAARLAARSLRRRASRATPPPVSDADFRATLEPWVAARPAGQLARHAFCYLPARRPPWYDTGLDLAPGQTVSVLGDGRVYLSKLLDIWVGPSFQLWCRVGEHGPVFRGTRATNTFTTQDGGRLWLASYFPGEWADPSGRLGNSPAEYAKVSGGLSALVLSWVQGTDVAGMFRDFSRDTRVPALVLAEARRLGDAVVTPRGWEYLWILGPGEIYQPSRTPEGRQSICCHTHGDVGILRHEARLPLVPGTRLAWSWRMDELPIDVAEDTVPSHDYLSIAVEFDDGQNITYYWSAELPEGTVFRCPLPTWRDRETHVVVRSGTQDLGRWLDEERDICADYRRILDGPAREIVRVWLIANSLFQRGHGRCQYASIRLTNDERTLEVL